MKLKNFLLAITCSCLLLACSEEIGPTDYEIREGITFKIREYNPFPKPSDPQLYLTINTIDTYHCSNSPIIATPAFKGGILDIEIFGVNDPVGACAFLGGPAFVSIDIAESVSTILLKHGTKRDRYRIKTTAERVEITPVFASFSSNTSDEYLRVPQNSFRYSCSTLKAEPTKCADFMDILKNNLDIQEHQFSDGSAPFNSDSESDARTQSHRQFVYNDSSTFELAKELLLDFDAEFNANGNASISIQDWRGEQANTYSN